MARLIDQLLFRRVEDVERDTKQIKETLETGKAPLIVEELEDAAENFYGRLVHYRFRDRSAPIQELLQRAAAEIRALKAEVKSAQRAEQ